MARKLRNIPKSGGIFHVYARGNARADIFLGDLDRRVYLRKLATVARDSGWTCLSYCLMPNHVHLLLEVQGQTLSRGMQRLHTAYAQAFNSNRDGVGHVFQGRYGSVLVESDQQLRAVAVYIARNPVEAGLCRHPDKWPWSSYRATIVGATPDWLDRNRLLSFFGEDDPAARVNFMRQCENET